MDLSTDEIRDLLKAIDDAQNELCVDLVGDKFPEATAYYRRLETLSERLSQCALYAQAKPGHPLTVR